MLWTSLDLAEIMTCPIGFHLYSSINDRAVRFRTLRTGFSKNRKSTLVDLVGPDGLYWRAISFAPIRTEWEEFVLIAIAWNQETVDKSTRPKQ